MDTPKRTHRSALLLAAALLIVPSVAGCASGHDQAAWTPGPAKPMATMQGTAPGAAPLDAAHQAAWDARPAFVREDARVQEAYAFAMASPTALQWIPCYCGCGAMGHTSNLDCYFKRASDGQPSLNFEEHASFCQVCVDESLMVKRMLAQGSTLREARAAIDAQFAGGAPGTPTELPPA